MPEVLTTIVFAIVGLLFIALARPFTRGTVPPNRLSGLRVRATFADPAVWYEANAATGRDLTRLGGAVLVSAFVAPWLVGHHATLVLAVGVVVGAVTLAVVGTVRANRLLAARERSGPPSASRPKSRGG